MRATGGATSNLGGQTVGIGGAITGNGGRPVTSSGGAMITGGMAIIPGGNTTTTGGTAGKGGTLLTTGGTRATTGGITATGGGVVILPPKVEDSGFVTVSTGTVKMSGYISSSTAGSGSSIALVYGTAEFCASGTVAPNTTYKSWAVAGFNVNQDATGDSGSTNGLALAGNTLSIAYINRGGTTLEFQLFDGSQYWCYYLPPASTVSTVSIPLPNLNTQCWDGKGEAFKSGTTIKAVNLVVPGSNSSKVAYDFCFEGLSVN